MEGGDAEQEGEEEPPPKKARGAAKKVLRRLLRPLRLHLPRGSSSQRGRRCHETEDRRRRRRRRATALQAAQAPSLRWSWWVCRGRDIVTRHIAAYPGPYFGHIPEHISHLSYLATEFSCVHTTFTVTSGKYAYPDHILYHIPKSIF